MEMEKCSGDDFPPWSPTTILLAQTSLRKSRTKNWRCGQTKQYSPRNIQPTSAIRGTLSEHSEGSRKDSRKGRTSLPYSPYPRNPSRHDRNLMEVGRHPINQHSIASPEASFLNSRPRVTLQVESSRVTAEREYTSAKRTELFFSDRAIEAEEKFSNRDKSQLLPSLSEVIARSSRHAFTAGEHAPPPDTPAGVLPPNFDRKRQRVRQQEASLSLPISNVVSARPHIILHPPMRQYMSPSVSPNLETVDARTPIDMDVEWEKLSGTKVKKNVMDWKIRREYLLQDRLLLDVEAKRVKCGPCNKWIKLDARNDYYPGLWLKHRRTMHGNTIANSPYSNSSRRKRSKPVQEESLEKDWNDGGSHTVCSDHNQVRRSSRGPISTRLRSSH